MSPERQWPEVAAGVLSGPRELAAAAGFGRHRHRRHQLAWARRGVLMIGVERGVWVLPPTRALWIPAGADHDVVANTASTMVSLYFEPGRCVLPWAAGPAAVSTAGIAGSLMEHLSGELDAGPRQRAEAVLFDLLEPLPSASLVVPMPSDDRAARVAAALVADPADDRSLGEWGRHVGASGRTLARLVERETGMGFTRWRTQVRVAAAVTRLAAGASVTRVAYEVGYRTPSAFIAAFHRTVGVPPGAYFADDRPRGAAPDRRSLVVGD